MASTLGMTTPQTLSDMNVDTGLLQKRWKDNSLYMESLLHEPFFSNKDLIKPLNVGEGKNMVSMPGSEYIIECTPSDKKGKSARSVELIFLKALNSDPIEGNGTSLIGNEDTLDLKYTTAYANDYRNGVTEETFGIDFRELNAYGVYDKIKPLLAQWLGEIKGYYARYALIKRNSPNLESTPVSLTAGLNPNFFVMGLAVASQPTYDSTLADHEVAIGAAVATGQGSTCHMTIPRLIVMIDWLRTTKYIEPGKLAGLEKYLLMACTEEFRNLRDPSVDNSFTRYWRDVGSVDDIAKTMPGVTKMNILDELVVCLDDRAPTMALTGTATDYDLTFGFVKAGRTTTRTASTGTGYLNVNYILGKGSLLAYEPEQPHYEQQSDEYTQTRGNGLFGALGYMLPVWDLDSANQTDSTAQQESACVVLTSRA